MKSIFRVIGFITLSVSVSSASAETPAGSSILARERAVEASPALLDAINEVVATQSGQKMTVGDLVAQVDRITPGKRLTGLRAPATLTAEFDRTLTSRILANEARRLGLDKGPIVALELQQMEDQILARRLLHSKLPDFNAAKLERAAQEQYRIKKKEFAVPEARSISHILISTDGRTRADALLKALEVSALLKKAGSSFEAVAASKSDDKITREQGGLVGDLTKGSGASMEAEVFAMQGPGILSNPVETPSGYHIVRLNEIKPARTQGYEEVKESLIKEIQDSASRMTREGLVNSLVGTEPFKLDQAALQKFFVIMGADEHALFQEADPKSAAAARQRAEQEKKK